MVIGRVINCDVPLDNTATARRHAALEWRRGELWVRDMGSTNTTRADDVYVELEYRLRDGSELMIGTAFLRAVSSA